MTTKVIMKSEERYKIKEIDFIGSFDYEDQCPQDLVPEYAFLGRSNVGKSTFINKIMERKQMAHTSSQPGKTRTINLFKINKTWMIADLPGYGYAKVSKKDRAKWSKMTQTYLLKRKSLVTVFLLFDYSIAPQKLDIEMAEWMAQNQVPFFIIFTKADKIKPGERPKQKKLFQDKFEESWEKIPDHFVVSGLKGEGRGEVLSAINHLNNSFYAQLNK